MHKITLKLLCISILSFCTNIYIYSQNYTFSGIVKDQDSLPVEFANIMILTLPDSTLVTGCITDSIGGFRVTSLKKGNYILKASFITFQDEYKEVSVVNNSFDAGTIYLRTQDQQLKEIVITSRQPPFKTKQGALIANVSNTQLSTLGTARDVIQRIPGIIDNDGSISVFGKGTPVVYVNNRIVNDFSELEILQSSDIDKVELITNPGANYNANGRAVILIKTKRKQAGFSAYASKRFQQGNYFGGDENINLTFTKNKLSFFASYNHLYQKKDVKEQDKFTARFDTIFHHNINTPHTTAIERNQVVGGFEWNKNDKHILGAQYQTFFTKAKTNINALSMTSVNGTNYENIQTMSNVKDRPNRHIANAFYRGEISQSTSVQLIFDYLKNYTKRTQRTKEVSALSEERFIDVINKSNFHLYASKMSLTQKTAIGAFDMGGEYNKITGDGFLINSKGYIKNNVYDNEEQKIAGFINYSYLIGGLDINTGIRYEHVRDKVTEDSITTLKVDRKYSSVYPNMSISKKFGNVQSDLSFSKKVQRPSFTQLNGNVTYTNQFIMQQGDPYLQKTDIYDVNLVTSYKKMYFNLGYIYQKDPIAFFSKKEGSVIYSTITNYPKYQEVNLTANYNSKIGWWEPNYTLTLRKPFFSTNIEEAKTTYNDLDLSIRAYNEFKLGRDFILSCNFSYQTDYSYYLVELGNYKSIDLGLRKSFIDKKLRFNLEIRDVFNSVKDRNVMKVNQIEISQSRTRETRFAMLSISYLFNNNNKKYRGSNVAKDDIDRF